MFRRIRDLGGIGILATIGAYCGAQSACGDEAWQGNVETALARVEAEQQHVSPTEPGSMVLRNVHKNLIATLALYESDGEVLRRNQPQLLQVNTKGAGKPKQPAAPKVHADEPQLLGPVRIILDEDVVEVEMEKQQAQERARNIDRIKAFRERIAQMERERRAPRERRSERESERPRERERDQPEARRAERERTQRERPQRERAERERAVREREAAPAKPHPRIVAAIGSQQEELKQLAERVERMEQQLRRLQQIQQRQPGRIIGSPARETDRPRRPGPPAIRGNEERAAQRERAMQEAREQLERRMNEQREQAMEAHERMMERSRDLEREVAKLSEHKRELEIQREQSQRMLERAQKELMERTKQLHEVESELAKLKVESSRNSAERRMHEFRLRQLDRRPDAERPARDTRRRETRKPAVPDDAI